MYTHTYTQPFNGPLTETTWVGRYQKKHSPTHTHPDHQTSFINFLHLLRSIASSLFNLRADSPFPQSLSRPSLAFLLVWDPLLHTPRIYSPNHHLIFATHAHAIPDNQHTARQIHFRPPVDCLKPAICLKRFLFQQAYPDIIYQQHPTSGPCSGRAIYFLIN